MSIESKPQLIRIVPNPPGESGLVETQGTRLFVGEQEVSGIQRVELVAEVNDVWRARIDCTITECPDLMALAIFHKPSAWARIKSWWRDLTRSMHGVDYPR